MMELTDLYKKIESHVINLYEKDNVPGLFYHNLEHTKQVVARTKEIAAHYNVSEKEMLILYSAAWFHDVGYLFADADDHEAKSAAIMQSYLQDMVKDEDVIPAAKDCILATKYPQKPKTILEEILCDADMYHLGTKNFKDANKKIRKERLENRGEIYTKAKWLRSTLSFMEAHHFHTSYCRDLLEEKKQGNIAKLRKQLEAREATDSKLEAISLEINPKNSLMTKGIQTMLRLTSDNSLKLSDMADRKASILISVNSIIISVIISVLVRRLEVDTYLTIPTILFLISSVSTVVVAILATRPKINEGKFTEQDVINKKTNLLFFGNFHKVPFEEYDNAMRKMMGDSDYLYGSLIKDIYMQGAVLGKKYRLTRLAYNIFMIGIIASVLAFAIAVYWNSVTSGASLSNGNSAAMPL
jgi:predicted metal-dependent HD superfamily phosphohydrolase